MIPIEVDKWPEENQSWGFFFSTVATVFFFFFLQTLEQELISIPVTIKLSLSYNFLKWLVQLPLRHLISAGNCRFPMFDLIAPEATFITWIPKCLSCNPLHNENKLTMLNYFD